ncbi:MAG: hypothetical protein KDA27_22025 [Candidatus Eisenbacteria bacterium]|uniref:Uncharacterized protein n=1 Tax=Eiseniibacteriota bacterium TaxID=2212470 RepID=A0A956NHB6_UNCEI|nr:hypothetical protein [Candidatus Eisenbacteria bacterium]MCB9462199.1 hypothetical protein [Candidatus Eisenbacteria bacterium]
MVDWSQYLIGAGSMTLLAVGWVGVQAAWKRSFPTAFADPDVLAGRRGCGACSSTGVCEKKSGCTRTSKTPKEVS